MGHTWGGKERKGRREEKGGGVGQAVCWEVGGAQIPDSDLNSSLCSAIYNLQSFGPFSSLSEPQFSHS